MIPDPLEEILGVLPRPRTRDLVTRRLDDEGHCITIAAWNALDRHHHRKDLDAFILESLRPLIPIANVAYRCNRVFCTSYDFDTKTNAEALWYKPNTYGGITIQLPEE